MILMKASSYPGKGPSWKMPEILTLLLLQNHMYSYAGSTCTGLASIVSDIGPATGSEKLMLRIIYSLKTQPGKKTWLIGRIVAHHYKKIR